MSVWREMAGVFRGAGPEVDRIVPMAGMTARLMVFAAATMAFLAVFALALSSASARLAERWGSELADGATVRLSAPEAEEAAHIEAVLRILETTRGVASARALSDVEQQALLAPWFGQALDMRNLPMPRLIDVQTTAPGALDLTGLRARLAAEAQGALVDDHSRWRAPLQRAAWRLTRLGWLSLILITAATAAIVTLAAQAALAAHAQVITVLRLVGATDAFIARAFVRRFTLRCGAGAALGAALGALALQALPGPDSQAGLLTGLHLAGADWAVVAMIPPLACLVAFFATRRAAQRNLEGVL